MEPDFKLIADASADCELWLALSGGVNWVNRTVEEYTGYTPAECLAWPDFPMPLIAEQDSGAYLFITQQSQSGHEARDLNLRLRHRDGHLVPTTVSTRLVQGQGGELVGLRLSLRRIEDPVRVELAMRRILQLVSRTTGQAFFNTLTQALGEAVGADLLLIGRLLPATHEVQTLAMTLDGQLQESVTYHLADTPCDVVMGQEVCIYPQGVADLFPKDLMLKDLGMDGYIGHALYDGKGNPTGILVALYRQPIGEPEWARTLLGLFAPRVGAEIERSEAEREMRALNESLEQNVTDRTCTMQQALDNLNATQQSLIQAEKLASLGALVAGIAHELNTPIGNALASVTALQQQTRDLQKEIKARGALTRQHFETFMASVDEGGNISHRNLERAANLIRSFKEVAVDQSSARRRRFDLAQTVDIVLLTLSPMLKSMPHQVLAEIPAGVELDSVPGALEQVITNLIDNALKHGFADGRHGHIQIALDSENESSVTLSVSDNGVGIPEELLPRIFDPFVSTRFGQGGSGLGLHVAYNLVTATLGGQLQVKSSSNGTCFVLSFPRVAPALQSAEHHL